MLLAKVRMQYPPPGNTRISTRKRLPHQEASDGIPMTCSAAVFDASSQVQILLKDVIGRGHKTQTFHSPLRIKRRGRLVDIGTLEANVCPPPSLL